MTDTLQRPDRVDLAATTPPQRERTFRSWVVALTLVVLGLGTWIVFDLVQEASLTPSSDVSKVIDDYTEAWNQYDGAAFLATTRAGYVFSSSTSGENDRDDQLAVIESVLPARSWQVRILAEPIVVGDGPWYYVSFPVEIETSLQGSRQGMSVLTIYHTDNDQYLVSYHRYIGR